MLIDFHMHTFPDAIAERAIAKLSKTANIPSCTNGTVSDTLAKMDEWKVDAGVFLNIATKPHQQRTINDCCLAMKNPCIIPFGSVHFENEECLSELERVKKLGMKGIKLHPDYQGFLVDDERLFPIYQKCADLGLVLLIHAGSDPASPDLIHAKPQAIAKVVSLFPNLKLIAAHFGGTDCWDGVLEYLAGKNLYLDTSFSAGIIPPEKAIRIIREHGADKILFGSDCPWQSPAVTHEFIRSFGLSGAEEDKIFYENALKLLK